MAEKQTEANTSSSAAQDRSKYAHADTWATIFGEEFSKESDRAAVIVAASIFDDSLGNLLRQYLVPIASSTDELFDGTNAPLATFSAKIAMAHRIGLISGQFARNLHLIRRIRNEFAHKIHGCTFEDSSIKARVLELYKSQSYKNKGTGKVPLGTRGDFLTVCLWMIWALNAKVQNVHPSEEHELEFGFTHGDHDGPKPAKKQKTDGG